MTRLVEALKEVGQTFELFQRGELGLCAGAPEAVPVPNLAPSTFCRVPAAPKTAKETVDRTFTVEVVDFAGRAAPDLLVEFQSPDRIDRVLTDAGGRASFTLAAVVDDGVVRIPEVAPQHPEALSRQDGGVDAYMGKALSAAVSAPLRLKLLPRVFQARLVGMLFEKDKTFILPPGLTGMEQFMRFYEARPTNNVLIVGHTDTTGSASYNQSLSEERAKMVAAFLKDDVEAWLLRYPPGRPTGKTWGVPEDKHMLSHVRGEDGAPFYNGPIDMVDWNASTRDAVMRFQRWSNANRKTSLVVDGSLGADTRRALITEYMDKDGATLPGSVTFQLHGCGEHHPIAPTADEVPHALNRRAEIFLFENQIEPPAPPGGSGPWPEYLLWVARVVLSIDLGDQPLIIVDVDWEV